MRIARSGRPFLHIVSAHARAHSFFDNALAQVGVGPRWRASRDEISTHLDIRGRLANVAQAQKQPQLRNETAQPGGSHES